MWTRTLRTRPFTSGTKKANGFTLIELIVAVVILAIGTTLVVVTLDEMLPQSRIQAAARNLGAQIADARSNAITQGYSYEMEYDLNEERYRLITPFKAGGGLALHPEDRLQFDWVELPTAIELKSLTIGGGEPIERGSVFVEFDALGSSIEHDIHLHRETPAMDFTLHVDSLTGLVRFFEGPPKLEKVVDADF